MQTGKKKKKKKNGKNIEKIMQSVSLRSFTALNPESGCSTARLWRPGRGSSSYRYGCRCRPTPGRVVSCFSMDNSQSEDSQSSSSSSSTSSSSSSSSSSLSRTQTYALLKQQLAVAAKSENYEEAARIRDSLRTFEDKEPVLRLRRLLNKAIHDENFKDAARYRDELKLVSPHSLLKCSSDATTLGIRVQVRSVYIESRSQPSKGQYFFAYRIRITNNSDRPVQLLRRHWVITDANGKTENIWGVGVIGEQPVILPRTGFEYSSACPLTTSSGRMEGDFEMKHVDMIGSSTFNVTISPFSLSIIGDDSDAI